MTITDLSQLKEVTMTVTEAHEQRIEALEKRLTSSDIYHPKFWSRAFAVYGHMIAAHFAVVAIIFVASFIIGLLAGLST